MSYFRIISNFLMLICCACSSPADDPYQQMVQGTITYPFYGNSPSLGKNGKNENFVIRTIAGNTEYVIEIPSSTGDYDVEVPIASLGPGDTTSASASKSTKKPQLTDRELVAAMPKPSLEQQKERALMDKAFGVGERGGPRQSPSYTLGIAKIGQMYRNRKYELALIEINNLLAHYPSSAKLYKMKGSTLIKLGHLGLAERAWVRAGELEPDDPVVPKGLEKLRRQMDRRQKLAKDQTSPDEEKILEGH